ncbi:MAG: 30S ribosomal protein S6 [Thermodesulfobacteriota bacterium]
MRRYETIFITDPDLGEQDREQVFSKTKDIVSSFDGFMATFDVWGSRKLAYEIKKKNRGHYVRMDYCGNGAMVDEVERSFRIDDRVLKFMTILLNPDVDLEKLKVELAQKEETARAAAAEGSVEKKSSGAMDAEKSDEEDEPGTQTEDEE